MTGFAIGVTVRIATTWVVRHHRPRCVDRWFHRLQLVTAAAYSLGHGTNDAPKGMGIITAASVSAGYHVPHWVIICSHLAMGGGTMAGGWRIIKTMGPAHHQADPLWGLFRGIRGDITLLGTAHFGIPSAPHTPSLALSSASALRIVGPPCVGASAAKSSGSGFSPFPVPPPSAPFCST